MLISTARSHSTPYTIFLTLSLKKKEKKFPQKLGSGGSVAKNPLTNAGDAGSILGLGRSPGKGNGNPLQYSCLANAIDRAAWRITVHVVTKSWI